MTTRLWSILCVTSMLLGACAADGPSGRDDEWGMDGDLSPTPGPGKDDSVNVKGILVATDTTRTQVWTAKNKWEDTSTAAAQAAGLAWSANSGLNWDEKYSRWVQSLPRIGGIDGYYDTFMLTTPWGKQVPSPALECAEMGIFLRITFAAWYQLPLFFEAVDSHGVRMYIGHNGVRTASGRYASSPEFAIAYADKSGMTAAAYTASWPQDAKLRATKLWDSEDNQNMIADGATIGTYLDEIHLNKRAGYFTVLALNYLSSVNIADTNNTYNLVPEAVRPGDIVLHRWQKDGIGHTLVVKDVTQISEGNLDVAVISGSMPRRQGAWESGAAAKQYFTSDDAGGEGTNSDGDQYVKLGGGLKRWRVAKNVGGYWTNTFMAADEAHWINSTDYPTLAARVARFASLLGEVSPEQTRDELVAQIEDSRRHLQQFPASCSARERRENAFDELYALSSRTWGQSKGQVDAAYRDPMDYTLAELDYTHSKTCCWDSSNANMYQIIKDYADKERADGAARGVCVQPTVFMSQTDGYARWQAFASSTGRGSQWLAWKEDETCNQRNVASDSEAAHDWTPICELSSTGGGSSGGGTCSDAFEPDDSLGTAHSVARGANQALEICSGDSDYFKVTSGGTVTISFTHAAGDLDMQALDASGNQLSISQGETNSETLTVAAGTIVRVYGYAGATNSYTLTVN